MDRITECEISKDQMVSCVYWLLVSGSVDGALRFCKKMNVSPKDEMFRPVVLGVIDRVYKKDLPEFGYSLALTQAPDPNQEAFSAFTDAIRLRSESLMRLILDFGINLNDLSEDLKCSLGLNISLRSSRRAYQPYQVEDDPRYKSILSEETSPIAPIHLASVEDLDLTSNSELRETVMDIASEALQKENPQITIDIGRTFGFDKSELFFMDAVVALMQIERENGDLEKALKVGIEYGLDMKDRAFRELVNFMVEQYYSSSNFERVLALGEQYLNMRNQHYQQAVISLVRQYQANSDQNQSKSLSYS